ncbi:14704_t:CDS:2 [Entrophospora sp. SA101]|nr:14704_t:CDS:2 [Entrophospora sp. SA101]
MTTTSLSPQGTKIFWINKMSQDQDHQQPKTPDHQDNQQSEAQCHHQKDQQRQDQSKTQRNRKQQQKSRVQYQQPKAPDHQNNQHQQPKTQDHHQKDKQRQEKSTTQNNLREQQPKNQRSNKTIIKSNNSYNGKRTANVINNNLDRSSMSQSTNKSAKIYEIPDPSLLPVSLPKQQQRSLPYPTIETFYSKKRKYKKLEISSDEEYNNVEEKILSASNSSLLSVSQGSPPLHPSMQQMLPLAPSSPFTISSPESSSSCLSQLSSEDFDYIISQQRSSISISFQSSSSSQVVKDHNGNDILVVNSQVEKRPLSQNESDINTKYVQKKKKISQKTVEF